MGEPIAWRFELAGTRIWEGNRPVGWGGWSEPKVSLTKPCVPEGSIRNLTPLYAGEEALREGLHLFREFVQRNATQWRLGAGWHGHPMWRHIAALLGPMPEVHNGPEWRFILPDNDKPLADLKAEERRRELYREVVEAVGEQEAERLIIADMGTVEAVHAHLVSIGSIEHPDAICRICDGGPGNECACNCGHKLWEVPAA